MRTLMVCLAESFQLERFPKSVKRFSEKEARQINNFRASPDPI